MKIALGADHRGFGLKELVKAALSKRGIQFEDFGAFSTDSADYPDYGLKVAKAVAQKAADYGVLICGTGNGMAITANKVKGIRAGLAINPEMARLTKAHNNANILVLSEIFTPESMLEEILDNFLNTNFEGGRHGRRVAKIEDFEQGRN
jgi:ribose 5-phosphate isomerase B